MPTLIQKYGAAIYSTAIFLLGTVAIPLLAPGGFTQDNLLGLIPLVVSTIVMYWGKGAVAKVSIELAGAVLALLVPAFFSGGDWTLTQWLLLGLGILKAAGTAFGYATRTDPTVQTPTNTITGLSAEAAATLAGHLAIAPAAAAVAGADSAEFGPLTTTTVPKAAAAKTSAKAAAKHASD